MFLVRKLGVPGHEEFAFGALASGGVRFINERTTERLGITPEQVEIVVAEQKLELKRRERLYRGDRPPVEVRGRSIILTDDGLATGSSMLAAVQALRMREPAFITVAVPVGAPETCLHFQGKVDEVLCGRTPEPFRAIGQWYQDFTQTTDQEVLEMLDQNAHDQKVREVRRRHAVRPTAEAALRRTANG